MPRPFQPVTLSGPLTPHPGLGNSITHGKSQGKEPKPTQNPSLTPCCSQTGSVFPGCSLGSPLQWQPEQPDLSLPILQCPASPGPRVCWALRCINRDRKSRCHENSWSCLFLPNHPVGLGQRRWHGAEQSQGTAPWGALWFWGAGL